MEEKGFAGIIWKALSLWGQAGGWSFISGLC